MNFEKMLSAFDMGICADQLQREALFELALLFVEIDGVQTAQEKAFIQNWIDECQWNSHLSKSEFHQQASAKVKAAIADNEVESFIRTHAAQIANSPIQAQALQLAEDVVMADGDLADGDLAEDEAAALRCLKRFLQ